HLFQRHFYAEIPASHHDAIGFLKDLLDVRPGLRFFDLRDDLHVRVGLFQIEAKPQHVVALADKRQCDKINARFQAEAQIGDVLLTHGRRAYVHSRQVDPFAVGDRAAAYHFANRIGRCLGHYSQFHTAVCEQDLVARLHVTHEVFISGGSTRAGSNDRVGGNAKLGARLKYAAAVLKRAKPDFRPLQIEEDADV